MKLLSISLWLSLAAVLGFPVASLAAPLPDGRAYELVSPAQKDGNMAGAGDAGTPLYAIAAAVEGAGEEPAVLFGGTGPMGATESGIDDLSVARRSSTGWATHAALPRPEGTLSPLALPIGADPSADLSRVAFTALRSYGLGNPEGEPTGSSGSLYMAGEDGSLEWLSKPLAPGADPQPGHVGEGLAIAGGSPELSTMYFTYYGTLVAEDATRKQLIEENGGASIFNIDWGFYELHDGTLTNAGELPNGTFSPYGAVPAATTSNAAAAPQAYGNEVSADGSDAFFVSPDPQVCAALAKECEGEKPELYVRVGGAQTLLLSRSDVLAPVGGHPAPAPDGVTAQAEPQSPAGTETFALASPDGSHVFFASSDRLTASGGSGGEYEFDVSSASLSYLPGVTGPVLASSTDGSRAVFENTATSTPELDLLSAGHATKMAALPAPAAPTPTNESGRLLIGPVRMPADGSVVVFQTDAQVPGFNDPGGFEQIYRYDTASSSLACVSCPPNGLAASGDATLGSDDLPGVGPGHPQDSRGVSGDGGEVYFQSPDPLLAQDVNGRIDVYEWQAGHVSLLSSGIDTHDSFLLDNSASGGDVFLTTAVGLTPQDTDGAYDVYDAREDGGFLQAQPPLCVGDCRALGGAPPLLGPASGSATYPAGENASGSPAGPKTQVKPPTKHKPTKSHKAHTKHKKKRARHKSAVHKQRS